MTEAQQDTLLADPIGVRLKAAREAQGLSLDDVAAKTRVPIRHLQHMERGEWDALPAPTYSVGFARAYAGAVGLNAAAIGTELRAQLGSAQQAPQPYFEPADAARVPPRSLALIAAVILVVLIAGYFIWRNAALGDVEDVPIITSANEIAPSGPGTAPAPGAASPSPAAARGPVVLTATNDVWLRVYEADGRKLFENTLKAGDRFEVPADAARPQILTGRPDALQVTVGSTAIPPLGPAEKTIADVSLLPADLLARNIGAPGPSPAPAPPPAAAAR